MDEVVEGVVVDEEVDDDVPAELLLPLSFDLLSEPLPVLALGAVLDDEPRLSVR